MMANLSDFFPPDTLTRVVAPVAEDVTLGDTLGIVAGGIYKKSTLAKMATTVRSGDHNTHAIAAGGNKVMVAMRGYNPPPTNSDTGTIYVAGFSVQSDGTLQAIGSIQTISTSVTNANTPLFATHIDGDYFALGYKTANAATNAVMRVVDMSGANPAFGATVNIDDTAAHGLFGLASIGATIYEIAGTGAKKWTRSGTSLTETALTLSGAPTAGDGRVLKAIGNTEGSPHFVCLAGNSGTNTFEKYYITGTTVTFVNTVASLTASSGTFADDVRATKMASNGGNHLYLASQHAGSGNVEIAGFDTGASDVASMTKGSDTDTGISWASNGFPIIWNILDGAFNFSYVDGSDYKVKKVTISGTTIGVDADILTFSSQENSFTETGVPLYYDATNNRVYLSTNDYQTDDDIIAHTFGTTEAVGDIGVTKDTATSGNDVTIVLPRSIAGVKEKVKADPGNLILGQNYYSGAGGLTTDNAAGKLMGWAITATHLIVAENAI